MQGSHSGKGRGVKRPRNTLGARSQSCQHRPSSPVLSPGRPGEGQLTRTPTSGSRRPSGGAVPAPPPARALAAPRDVTLGYKSRGARLSRSWRSSRLRAGWGRRVPGTPGRERLCDVLLRAAHRGQPQGDRHAAAAPNEASCAVHPQGLGRPAAPGRPQEAGLVQGHGEPRGRPLLGAPRGALRAAPFALRALPGRPLQLSLSHRHPPAAVPLCIALFRGPLLDPASPCFSSQDSVVAFLARAPFPSAASLRVSPSPAEETLPCFLPSGRLSSPLSAIPNLTAWGLSLAGCLAGPVTQTEVIPNGWKKE